MGSIYWTFDVHTAVMSMSSFRAAPRKVHLERFKRIYRHLSRFKHFKIRFRVEEPDMSGFYNKTRFDRSTTVFGNPTEELPTNTPEPLGKRVTLIHYFDANLMHDVLSGKAVTGCLHLANKTPMIWYSKKQATSETDAYGSEFISGRMCVEQVVDLQNSFRYLGVPVNVIRYVFGENESMINSSSFLHAKLHKRHIYCLITMFEAW